MAAAGIVGKDWEVEAEAVAKVTVPELLVATHPPLEIPSQRSPVAPLVEIPSPPVPAPNAHPL